jgi:hypothetical protein
MSVLFLDCSQGISEQALLSGLMNLGLFSELLVPLADLFPSNADEIRRAIRNKTFSTIQIAGKTKAQPGTSLQLAMEALEGSKLPVKVIESARKVYTQAGQVQQSETGLTLSEDELWHVPAILWSLEALHVDELHCPPLPVSIPATGDAALKILQLGHIPLGNPVPSFQVSPFLAALLAVRAIFSQPEMYITKISTAVLDSTESTPKSLRLIYGERIRPAEESQMILLQMNLDDITAQQSAYIMEELSASGAMEAYQVPILMKKNRMGMQINVTARASDKEKLCRILFRETPTLGIRIFQIDGHPMCSYEIRNIQTEYGVIPVKIKMQNGEIIGAQPEFEVCAQKARELDLPLQGIVAAAQSAVYNEIKKGKTDDRKPRSLRK